MTDEQRAAVVVALAWAAHNMKDATRKDLIELNQQFEHIPDEDGMNAASVWAETIVSMKESRDEDHQP